MSTRARACVRACVRFFFFCVCVCLYAGVVAHDVVHLLVTVPHQQAPVLCVCVCVFVCEGDDGTQREGGRESERE